MSIERLFLVWTVLRPVALKILWLNHNCHHYCDHLHLHQHEANAWNAWYTRYPWKHVISIGTSIKQVARPFIHHNTFNHDKSYARYKSRKIYSDIKCTAMESSETVASKQLWSSIQTLDQSFHQDGLWILNQSRCHSALLTWKMPWYHRWVLHFNRHKPLASSSPLQSAKSLD